MEEYYGCFFAAYREDGSAFVWYPLWERKPKFSKEICEIIKEGLETAPIEDRKIVAENKLGIMKWIGPEACDDHNMSSAFFGIDSVGITSGHESYGCKGVDMAYDKTKQALKIFNIGEEGLSNE